MTRDEFWYVLEKAFDEAHHGRDPRSSDGPPTGRWSAPENVRLRAPRLAALFPST